MPSTTETGHAKNVATFEDLITFCTGYGTPYNPSKAALKIAALITHGKARTIPPAKPKLCQEYRTPAPILDRVATITLKILQGCPTRI